MAPGGTYTLVCSLRETACITVGRLGQFTFPAGYYAYTGSALGPGGFSRVNRHVAQLEGTGDTRHWHIDYLTTAPDTRFYAVRVARDEDIECDVSQLLTGDRFEGFGCSDCTCHTHLHYEESAEEMIEKVQNAYGEAEE